MKRMIEEMTRLKEQSVKSFSDEKKLKQEERV